MRNLHCFLFAFFFAASASAQKVYFIYLQTDNGSPFYVKMNDKIYSSSTPGYLVLSNLIDSTYNLSIGFPSSQSESKFIVPVAGRDRGLLIKNFDYGLGLFDLQTMSVIRSVEDESKKGISYRARNDDFTTLLSRAANDTTLLFVPILVKQDVAIQQTEPKPEEIKPKIEEIKSKTEEIDLAPDTLVIDPAQKEITEIKNPPDTLAISAEKNGAIDSLIVNKLPQEETPVIDSSDRVPVAEEYKRSAVRKYSESSTSEGFGLVFYDSHGSGIDTIRLLIPNPKIMIRQPDTVKVEESNLFLEIGRDSLNKQISANEEKRKLAASVCPSLATNNDFLKLRKNMAAENTDEAMIDEAKKYFRNKCFSTEQIKNLSALFLTSSGKYVFFDAAYMHVSDQYQFNSLEAEIKDEYYIKRFKALIGE